MPRLKTKSSKRTYKVTARLTPEEEQQVVEAARRRNLSPSAFAREVLLASTRATISERLILAKACKVEALLQLFFGGLFAQLNDKKPFEKDHFRQAIETAELLQFRKADEHMSKHGSANGEVIYG